MYSRVVKLYGHVNDIGVSFIRLVTLGKRSININYCLYTKVGENARKDDTLA